MCIALIGGMDRLERHYRSEAEKYDIDLKVFSTSENDITAKVRHVDALVIFTNKISHRVKREVMNIAKARSIPVFMYHSCGVCTLRDCFSCLKNTHKEV